MLFFGAILVMENQPMVSASEALIGGLANLSPDYRQWHFYLNIGYALAVIGIIIMGSAVIPSKSKEKKDVSSLEILKDRYAKGEITKEKFDEMKKNLGD